MMRINCPVASGSGAYIIHKMLADSMNGYRVCAYNPWLTTFPPVLYAVCRQDRADLIHTTPDYALFSKQKNTPLVITFHNYVLDHGMRNYSSPLQRLHYSTDLKWLTRLSVARASVITAVSHFTAEQVANELGLERQIRVIYNGIDERRFAPRKTRPNGAGKVRVLFSGNLIARKGADLLPAIVNRLNPGIELLYTTGLRSKQRLP